MIIESTIELPLGTRVEIGDYQINPSEIIVGILIRKATYQEFWDNVKDELPEEEKDRYFDDPNKFHYEVQTD